MRLGLPRANPPLRDPRANARVEHVERQRALAEHLIVERTHVEAVAQLVLGVRTERADLELAALVRERLAGPYDVAVVLRLDLRSRLRAVGREVRDRLLARPAHLVDARVEHEADRAPHLVGELAEPGVRVAIQPEVGAEAL